MTSDNVSPPTVSLYSVGVALYRKNVVTDCKGGAPRNRETGGIGKDRWEQGSRLAQLYMINKAELSIQE